MVFNTDGPVVVDPWYAANLDLLDEYTFEGAMTRFSARIDADDEMQNDAEGEGEDADDEFEKLLDLFVKSQSNEDQEEAVAEQDTSCDTDGTVIDEESECDDSHHEREPAPAPVPESPLKALDTLTGLYNVKSKLQAYEKLVNFNRMRRITACPLSNFRFMPCSVGHLVRERQPLPSAWGLCCDVPEC